MGSENLSPSSDCVVCFFYERFNMVVAIEEPGIGSIHFLRIEYMFLLRSPSV